SAMSHAPFAARHTVELGAKPSAGQLTPVPVQFSATSQTSTWARHTVVDGANTSAGQVPLVPVQLSGTSQTPAAARHSTPAATNKSVGHAGLRPVQVSTTSQMPTDGRQVVPAMTKASIGQVAESPVHVSATSHAPAAARHTTPKLPGVYWHAWATQVSTVHGLLSLQSAAVTHCWQPAIGVWTQPEDVLQLSAVQALPSSQLRGDPGLHVPPWEVAVPLRGFRSAQSVPFGRTTSGGQLTPVPLQASGASQIFAAARQIVPPVAKPSGGQAAAVPVHISATSHKPAEGRHC